MLWIDTETWQQAEQLQDQMWGMVAHDTPEGIEFTVRGEGLFECGKSWGDAIARLKDNPDERLNLAIRHLPRPAAFSEVAISLRAIIRRHKKQNSDCAGVLGTLYRLAAIWSFGVPYAKRLGQPGYNVFARVPFSKFASMCLTWDLLGCDQLELLGKTDRRWMRDVWGEPKTHTTAHEKYRAIWDRYEDMLIKENQIGMSSIQVLGGERW